MRTHYYFLCAITSGGTFTCAGYNFAGIYGVYKYRGSVIFETWEADDEPTLSE